MRTIEKKRNVSHVFLMLGGSGQEKIARIFFDVIRVARESTFNPAMDGTAPINHLQKNAPVNLTIFYYKESEEPTSIGL